jgi:drug/metabolite transporter (DMT)-like permease
MPLWAALFAAISKRDQLAQRQWFGVVIGLAGLALFLDPSVLAGSSLAGVVFVFAAAASWGLGAVIHRAVPLKTPPLSQTFYQLIASGGVLALLAIVLEADHPMHLTGSLASIMVWNWLVPTSLAVWSWNRVLMRLPAATAGQLLMATPLVGIAASAIIFRETVPPVFATSTVLVIAGALLVLLGHGRSPAASLRRDQARCRGARGSSRSGR